MAYRTASLAFRAMCTSIHPVRSFHATSRPRSFKPISKDFLVPKTTTPQLLESYLAGVSTALPPNLVSLQEETVATFPDAHKMTSPVQGRLLYHLVRMTRPRLVLELGCFTGFGAISMALGLGPDPQQRDGKKLVTCEIDEKAAEVARRWVTKCGVEDVVEIRMGSALDTIKGFPIGISGIQFDFIFIDADKGNYINYYNTILNRNLLSPDGVIIADNTLFRGEVHCLTTPESNNPEESQSPDAEPPSPRVLKTASQMRAFNEHVKNDPRTEQVVLSIFDGVSIIQRKTKMQCVL